jgi:hypothetical protein
VYVLLPVRYHHSYHHRQSLRLYTFDQPRKQADTAATIQEKEADSTEPLCQPGPKDATLVKIKHRKHRHVEKIPGCGVNAATFNPQYITPCSPASRRQYSWNLPPPLHPLQCRASPEANASTNGGIYRSMPADALVAGEQALEGLLVSQTLD